MPRGDGMGPMGYGPMTGRGAGYCAGFARPGYASGFGFNRGRGYRRMYYACDLYPYHNYAYPQDNMYAQDEKQVLLDQAKSLENQLASIKKRLDDLESEK